MQKTFLRLGRWLLVVTLFLAIGGHWALLQTVAWASMIVDYSRNSALTEAVEKTFDGQHPCNICRQIQTSQQSEKQQPTVQLIKKIELFHQPAVEFIFASNDGITLAIPDFYSGLRTQAPAVPPPRVA